MGFILHLLHMNDSLELHFYSLDFLVGFLFSTTADWKSAVSEFGLSAAGSFGFLFELFR